MPHMCGAPLTLRRRREEERQRIDRKRAEVKELLHADMMQQKDALTTETASSQVCACARTLCMQLHAQPARTSGCACNT